MANKKRGRPPSNKKNNTTRSKTTTKAGTKATNKTGAKSTARATNKAGAKKISNIPTGIRAEMLGVIFIALSVLIAICIFNENGLGFIGSPISKFLRHLLGMGALFLPLALLGYGVYLIAKKDKEAFKIKFILSVVFMVMLISIVHIISLEDNTEGMRVYDYIGHFWKVGDIKNGGLVGAILGGICLKAIGVVGTYIVFIAAAIISFMAMSGKSIYSFIMNIIDFIQDLNDEEEYEDDDYEDEYVPVEPIPQKRKKTTESVKTEKSEKPINKLVREVYEPKPKKQRAIKGIENIPVRVDSRGRVMTVDIKKEEKNLPKISLITDEIKKNKPQQPTIQDILLDKVGSEVNMPPEFEYEPEPLPDIEEKMPNIEMAEPKEFEKEVKADKKVDTPIEELEKSATKIVPEVEEISTPPWEEPSYKDGEEPVIIEAEETKIVDKLKIDAEAKKADYKFPKLEFLGLNPNKNNSKTKAEMLRNSQLLENTLSSFGVEAKVNNISQGPTVTRYELTPSVGTRVNKIVSLEDDIALSLAARSIRIEAPIPGKSAVGIEIPNEHIQSVYLSEVIRNEKFQNFSSKLAFGLGKDITGNVIVTDIAKMPHMLIAGATGSGKSVCINTLIASILYKATPEEVRLIMVDPKVVELSVYNGIPHLLIPVVTDPQKAAGALNWAVREMMRRYELFSTTGTRNLKGYNEKVTKEEKIPQIVLIIDELADLMMVAKKEVEDSICRLAQLARAAGIHLIIATQRPSVDVITGLIKANIPSRIAFAVSSSTDSRTVLDTGGAEKLLGKGDMLFRSVDMSKPLRVQGAFVTDSEVEKIVDYVKTDNPNYDENVINEITKAVQTNDTAGGDANADSDVLTDDVIAFLVKSGKASTGMVQRKFRIGYNRAARIIDELEERGIIGPENGSKPREVYMDRYELRDRQERYEDYEG